MLERVLVRRRVRRRRRRCSGHRRVVMMVLRRLHAMERRRCFAGRLRVQRVRSGSRHEGTASRQQQARDRRAGRQCDDREESQPGASAKAATNGAHRPTVIQHHARGSGVVRARRALGASASVSFSSAYSTSLTYPPPVTYLPVFAAAQRRVVVLLLVCLVMTQGMAVGVLTTLGPAHMHKPASRIVVLDDFRRAPSGVADRELHVLTAFGHFHSDGGSERHYHARSDGSVMLADAGSPLTDDNDGAISSAIALVALFPAAPSWPAPEDSVAPTGPVGWASITDDPEPLYRPPQHS